MTRARFDHLIADTQAMPVAPVDTADFDLVRYEEHAAECDRRYAEFFSRREGIAVWQRVRVADVFRDGCRDMRESLRWQLGALTRSLDYMTDAPAYLEPWYGIGAIASAYGCEYEWPEEQAPVVRPVYDSVEDVPRMAGRAYDHIPILRYTLDMIEFFLDQTSGRVPISWCDIQSPLDVAMQLVDTRRFLLECLDVPIQVERTLSALADTIVAFTRKQTDVIGDALARPGHGFASSRAGTGIGLSDDNMAMISPKMYEALCVETNTRIGAHFGGTAIHSCGNWERWLEPVSSISNLRMIDAAFSPQTDPEFNDCEPFRNALANTGIILQARIVGRAEEVLDRVRRLWTPGLKLFVVTYIEDPATQRRVYEAIHRLCS
jgi:hypothetical protein